MNHKITSNIKIEIERERGHNAARFARTTPATRYDEVRRRDDDDDDDARVPLSGDSIGFNARWTDRSTGTTTMDAWIAP